MTNRELIDYCVNIYTTERVIDFPQEILNEITEEQATILAKEFGSRGFIKLPASEIAFFEWVKQAEPAVWADLWENEEEEPYVVGISFLPALLRHDGRGFPICDLVNCDNYYFSPNHMVDEESKAIIESAQNRFLKKEPLTIPHLLALEISTDPIDIWHFCYKHNVSLKHGKAAVAGLVDDHALVHLTNAEHIAPFVV